MTETLKPTKEMREALERRRLAEVLMALRLKIDGEPGLKKRIGDVEGLLLDGDLAGARDGIAAIETWRSARADLRDAGASLASTARLAAAREETVEPTATSIQVVSRDGLAWLVRKGRLVGNAKVAAERYRNDYATAHGSIASGLGQPEPARRVFQGFSPSEAVHKAIWDLDEARKEALGSDQGLIALMDSVAGRGETLRDLAKGDKHQADRLETELLVACRLLARHYGAAVRQRA